MNNPSHDLPQGEEIKLQSTGSVITHVGIDYVSAATIGVSYTTLPGNMPQTFGNTLLLWQNSAGSIPWTMPPLASFPIPNNTPNGSTSFPGLNMTNNSYVVGLAVGPKLTGAGMQTFGNICSSVFIPNLTGPNTFFDSTLTLVFVGPSSVAVSYSLPSGIQPLSNGAWIGIWTSGSPSYQTAPQSAVPVSANTPSGTVAFNNFPVGIGQQYTVALFTSGYNPQGGSLQTAMAAYVTFNS